MFTSPNKVSKESLISFFCWWDIQSTIMFCKGNWLWTQGLCRKNSIQSCDRLFSNSSFKTIKADYSFFLLRDSRTSLRPHCQQLRPEMKLPWNGEIKCSISSFILLTITFEISLYIVLQRLMGPNWLIPLGLDGLRIKQINVSLRFLGILPPKKTFVIIEYTDSLTISQIFW